MKLLALTIAALLALAAPASAKIESASNGTVTAELSYVPDPDGGAPTGMVERVYSDGDLIVQRRIPDKKFLYPGGGSDDSSVRVFDLDGDGSAEAIFDLYTGGAHCCLLSDVYDGKARQTFQWGNVGYELRDFEGDGVPELATYDDRFSGLYSAYAYSFQPVLAYRYTANGLKPFTRDPAFVATLKRHSARAKRLYERFRPKAGKPLADTVFNALLAGYTADRCNLGACEQGYALVAKAIARGETDARFLRRLRKDLRAFGYDRG